MTIELQQFKENFSVCLEQKVIWGDMDAFQHVNNTIYFRYFETARMEYFIHAGITQYMQEHKVGPILGTSQCKFIAALTFPDDIIVGIKIDEIKEKRFNMQYEIFSIKMNKVAAQGNGMIVYVDYNTNNACLIPDVIRQNIMQIENKLN